MSESEIKRLWPELAAEARENACRYWERKAQQEQERRLHYGDSPLDNMSVMTKAAHRGETSA